MENHIEMNDLGGFPILGNLQIGMFTGLRRPLRGKSAQEPVCKQTVQNCYVSRRDPERGLQSWFRPAKPETDSEDLPSPGPIETLYNVSYCVMTVCLRNIYICTYICIIYMIIYVHSTHT